MRRALIMLTFVICPVGLALTSVLGDRLVVSVNNTTYSQRQVETYVLVREALREEDQGGALARVTAKNWEVALKFFAEEMSIHQEALRLGSLQVPTELLRQSVGQAKDRLDDTEDIKSLSRRLGIDDVTLTRTVNNILRVETFRRSRNRQEAIAKTKEKDDSQPQWLVELYDRTIIRFYDGAWEYAQIQPTQGQTSGEAL